MTYILTHQLLGGKYSRWIVILQEFDLVFTTAKSKKSLVFAELICSPPFASLPTGADEKLPDEKLFLISTLNPCVVWCVIFQATFLLIMFLPALQMLMSPHIGFANGACLGNQNLSSAAWAIYEPHGELTDLQGICLDRTTNNIVEYSVVIELLSEAIALDIQELVVNLDSQLVVLQLNGNYSIRNPQILRMYLCICLLERSFYYITYHHIPRHMNTLTDALANYVLDRHLRNM
eukprot:PITA_21732